MPGVVKFIEPERRMMGEGLGGVGSWCLLGTEFQAGKTKKFWRRMAVMVAQQHNVNASKRDT